MSIIVNTGALKLQDAQATYLAGCFWGLYTNVIATEDPGTVWADLTEAAWAGYARQTVGAMNAAAIVSGRAQATPVAFPSWTNSSGAPVTYQGWFLADPVGPVLLDYHILGTNTIPDGGITGLATAISDRQE